MFLAPICLFILSYSEWVSNHKTKIVLVLKIINTISLNSFPFRLKQNLSFPTESTLLNVCFIVAKLLQSAFFDSSNQLFNETTANGYLIPKSVIVVFEIITLMVNLYIISDDEIYFK